MNWASGSWRGLNSVLRQKWNSLITLTGCG